MEVSTAPSIGSLKLGQPIPLSNFPLIRIVADHRLQHRAPPIGAVHVPGGRVQRSRSPNWLKTNNG